MRAATIRRRLLFLLLSSRCGYYSNKYGSHYLVSVATSGYYKENTRQSFHTAAHDLHFQGTSISSSNIIRNVHTVLVEPSFTHVTLNLPNAVLLICDHTLPGMGHYHCKCHKQMLWLRLHNRSRWTAFQHPSFSLRAVQQD